MSADVNPAHRVAYQAHGARDRDPNSLGMPVRYYDGPYAGKVILTIIEEVQKPDLGRKYGLRDSRPLDPPAVVQVRLFEIKNHGTPQEHMVEIDVDAVHTPGLICYADLYPYNPDFEDHPLLYADSCPPPTPIQPHSGPIDPRQVLACGNVYPPSNLPRQPRVPLPRAAALPQQLHGERHQNVIIVPDIRGSAKKVMYFVFSELHVRLTGHFMLKYTAMSVDHSLEQTKRVPMLAECWGGVFAIYPSKLHPPLKPSTELTTHLSRCGAKLHSRNKQRFGRGSEPQVVEPTVAPGAAQNDDDGSDDAEDSPVLRIPDGPVSVAFIRDAALAAASYDRAWLQRPLQSAAREDDGALPPLNVAIPEHASARWAASNARADTGAVRELRLHGEISRDRDRDRARGSEDGWREDEMETEKTDAPRATLGWSSSNVRGD